MVTVFGWRRSGGGDETAIVEVEDTIGVSEGVGIVGGGDDTGAPASDLVDEPPHQM
jgi:hypothetical protein